MRLKVSKSKNAASFYVTKTIYENGKERTITVEKLGTEKELREKLDGQDPYAWAKTYVSELTAKEKENQREILAPLSPIKQIEKNHPCLFNGGYLFLQDIYYDLKLDKICQTISDRHKFSFDLNSILSYLIYGRIIYPASKRATHELSQKFLERPSFELQHVYRALEVLAKEFDWIQAQLYKNSLAILPRNTRVLFYDCTNFFFEIEQEEGLKQYGLSKEHRPNPIVQMGLFMDGNGMPLAFSIQKGNTNEQTTLKPLEKKILSDFELSQFIVCTDAGLASTANRKYNNLGNRGFITVQSVKKLKAHLKDWALDPKGWRLAGQYESPEDGYDVRKLSYDSKEDRNKNFYKERWINEDGLEQRLIVTYSLKYRIYQEQIRNRQVERAQKLIDTAPQKFKKANQNDYKRFIEQIPYTSDGEKAEKVAFSLNQDVINKEARYDGFYAVCTNLASSAEEIIAINHRRWEIEESFRIMKSELRSRPVYLSRDDRIIAHFMTCFISLMVVRVLEKKMGEKFTCQETITKLREMNFMELRGEGFIPAYTKTDFTDSLHEPFGFRTDYQILPTKKMKKIFKMTKTTKKVRTF